MKHNLNKKYVVLVMVPVGVLWIFKINYKNVDNITLINKDKSQTQDIEYKFYSIGHKKELHAAATDEPILEHKEPTPITEAESCRPLLEDGYFNHTQNKWHAYGCDIHYYELSEVRQCLHRRKVDKPNYIVFIGDSRVRMQYRIFLHKITGNKLYTEKTSTNNFFTDKETGFAVDMQWNCYVANDRYKKLYGNWVQMATSGINREEKTRNVNRTVMPEIVINGGATWTMMQYKGQAQATEAYRESLVDMVPHINQLLDTNKTRVIWTLQEAFDEKKAVQHHKNFIKNKQQQIFNNYTRNIFNDPRIEIWNSQIKLPTYFDDFTFDGLHIHWHIIEHNINMLINILCNDYLDEPKEQRLCCKTAS